MDNQPSRAEADFRLALEKASKYLEENHREMHPFHRRALWNIVESALASNPAKPDEKSKPD